MYGAIGAGITKVRDSGLGTDSRLGTRDSGLRDPGLGIFSDFQNYQNTFFCVWVCVCTLCVRLCVLCMCACVYVCVVCACVCLCGVCAFVVYIYIYVCVCVWCVCLCVFVCEYSVCVRV